MYMVPCLRFWSAINAVEIVWVLFEQMHSFTRLPFVIGVAWGYCGSESMVHGGRPHCNDRMRFQVTADVAALHEISFRRTQVARTPVAYRWKTMGMGPVKDFV